MNTSDDITLIYGNTDLVVLKRDAFLTALKNACNGSNNQLCTGSGVIWDSTSPMTRNIIKTNLMGASIFPNDLSYYFGWDGVPWAPWSSFWIAAHTGVKSKNLFKVTPKLSQ